MSNEPANERQEVLQGLFHEFRVSGTAQDAYDGAVSRRMGVNRTDLACLDVLERAGPMTAGHLAEMVALSPGAVTAVLDRLEEAGYARRIRDPDDRRRVLAEVTPKMKRASERLYGPMAELAARELEAYTTDELRLIRDFLKRSRELQLEHAKRIRDG